MVSRCLRLLILAVLLAGVAPGSSGAAAQAQQWQFDGVERVVVFGDVHGAYEGLVALLRRVGVVDADLGWAGGGTHLVSLGDLLDRGPGSRRVMDLLMRLQDEAPRAGGRVHVVLGNHEQMNITGDLRYVAEGEWAAFAGPRDDALRARAADAAKALGITLEARPSGFYAHREAFLPNGAYGAWLLQQPLFLRIDGRVFMHGGLGPEPGDPEALQRAYRAALRRAAELRAEPALQRPDRLGVDLLELSRRGEAETDVVDTQLEALRPQLEAVLSEPLFAPLGPLWYRGNSSCHPLLETVGLDAALAAFDARAVVVGHTPTVDRTVRERLGGRVLMLDTGMLSAYYGGSPRALVIEDEALRVVSVAGDQERPKVERPAVDAGLDADRVEALLGAGALVLLAEADDGVRRVRVSDGELSIIARVLGYSARAARNEAAARQLDRLLGLGMVPATAVRELDGRRVLLQVEEGLWFDEAARSAAGANAPNWCARGHVYDLVRLFDALIGNSRRPETLAYRRPDWALRLTGHERAFPTNARVPEGGIDPAMATLLRRLDSALVRSALTDGLGERRVDALLRRRDALLSGA